MPDLDEVRRFLVHRWTDETESLKRKIAARRDEFTPFCLDLETLMEVCRWKLDRQFARVRAYLVRISDGDARTATAAAFAIEHPDGFAHEASIRIGLLTALPGIGLGVSSAILALAEPDRYCIIDWRGWRALYGEQRDGFSVGDYVRYVGDVRSLSRKLNASVQQTDSALWRLDLERHATRAE